MTFFMFKVSERTSSKAIIYYLANRNMGDSLGYHCARHLERRSQAVHDRGGL